MKINTTSAFGLYRYIYNKTIELLIESDDVISCNEVIPVWFEENDVNYSIADMAFVEAQEQFEAGNTEFLRKKNKEQYLMIGYETFKRAGIEFDIDDLFIDIDRQHNIVNVHHIK